MLCFSMYMGAADRGTQSQIRMPLLLRFFFLFVFNRREIKSLHEFKPVTDLVRNPAELIKSLFRCRGCAEFKKTLLVTM